MTAWVLLLLAAQSDPAPFLATARAATAQYQDAAVAIRDGYRPMGPESPSMGQHWVHIGRLLAGRVDPRAPAILQYVTVNGELQLVGVAFAVVLDSGSSPPDTPVPAAWWHGHHGTLSFEGLNGSHAGMSNDDGDRVAVLHTWVWLTNPAGAFEAENWLLPLAVWVRGMPGPPAPAEPPDPSAFRLPALP